jgi:hypothetical protein
MKQSDKNNRLLEIIVGLVVLLVAIGAIAGAGYFYLKNRDTRKWPAVEGVITKSDTRIQRSPGSSGAPTTIADVWYKFIVDGIAYRNDAISLAQYGSSSASHAVREAHRYPVGRRVMVYYNPENPYDSVLEHKTPWVFIGIFAGLGAVLIFIGISMLNGGFGSSPSTTAKYRNHGSKILAQKAPAAKGVWLIAVFLASTLIAVLSFYLYFNKNAEHHPDSVQSAAKPLESDSPEPVSSYFEKQNFRPCEVPLKAQVAERQRIRLDDGSHTLHVTATLCIDENEMKSSPQAQKTWPIIAQQLASYDKFAFDPGSDLITSNGGNSSEGFRLRLEQIEQECIESLQENDIFFVKTIRFDFLQVFMER